MLKTKGNSIIFGGCWACKSGLRFLIWALEVPFSGTSKWALLVFPGAQKWDLQRPNKKTETTFKSPTSPKNDGISFGFKRLPLLDGFLAHFEILYFLAPSGALFPVGRTPNRKTSNECRLCVHIIETLHNA